MKVTIDTAADSYEDIQKVFYILAGMIERKEGSSGLNSGFSNYHTPGSSSSGSSTSTPTTPVDTSSMMNMFDSDTSASSTASKPTPESAPNFGSFLNLVPKTEPKEERARIEFY